jgi:hypothetical protein
MLLNDCPKWASGWSSSASERAEQKEPVMSSSARLFPLLLISALLLHPRAAAADTIQVTAGFLSSVGQSGNGPFQFISNDFLAVGFVDSGVVMPALLCLPCVAGDPIDLSSSFIGPASTGPAVFEGTFYPQVRWGADLFFDAPTVTMPATPGFFTLTDRFTFRGELVAYSSPFEDIVAFRTALTGQGRLFASFSSRPQPPVPERVIEFRQIRYEFEPVPEPGTLLLVATGVGAALGARKRARRQTRAG